MPTFASATDVPTCRIDTADGPVISQRVYGIASSLTVTELPPDFRPRLRFIPPGTHIYPDSTGIPRRFDARQYIRNLCDQRP